MIPAAMKLNPKTSNVEVSSLKPLFFHELTVLYPKAVSRKMYADVYKRTSQPIRYGPTPKRNQVAKVKNCSTAFASDSLSGETFDGEIDSISTAPVHISNIAIANRQIVFLAKSARMADLI